MTRERKAASREKKASSVAARESYQLRAIGIRVAREAATDRQRQIGRLISSVFLNLMLVALMMESVSLGCVMFHYGTSESQIENHTFGQSV
jgi:hypothetical protein